MDLNACGLERQEPKDHANPAAIRLLAEAADTQFQSQFAQLHAARWLDVAAWRPSADQPIPANDASVLFDSCQFCTWADPAAASWPLRPGIWMIGATFTMLNFAGTVTALSASVMLEDYRGPRYNVPTVTRYRADGYKGTRGEENLCVAGMVEIFEPNAWLHGQAQKWGTGTGDISATRTWMWAARVRGNSG